ncbi:MAG TPA: LysM peptidoglycan-binding domain-containing protein [Clostridia bacterium]|nr:LysM peptidoglycan-binding domain-containing protein [Clostridia bacterium]
MWLVVLVLLALWWIGPTVTANDKVRAASQAPWQEIVVREGDTLWKIAMEYRRPKEDVRVTINRIQEANGLAPSEYIYPGQVLLIPLEQ